MLEGCPETPNRDKVFKQKPSLVNCGRFQRIAIIKAQLFARRVSVDTVRSQLPSETVSRLTDINTSFLSNSLFNFFKQSQYMIDAVLVNSGKIYYDFLHKHRTRYPLFFIR